jgi:monoamine oxidase
MRPQTATARGGDVLRLAADCVIVTASLGVLKAAPDEGGIRFSPPLPAGSDGVAQARGDGDGTNDEGGEPHGPILKRDAIEAMGFGHENKVVLRFTDRFWLRRRGATHTHWQCLDQRFRFINMDALGKDGTIVAHVGPPFSVDYVDERTGQRCTDGQVVAKACECLRQMFNLDECPSPVQHHVTRWTTDELARGSYSFVATGGGSDMCNTLGSPEWAGRLCFAGEACCEERVQCVDGAVVSGRQAAQDALDFLRVGA